MGPNGVIACGGRAPPRLLGAAESTIADLAAAGGPTTLPLRTAVIVDEATLREAPIFVDYFRGGFEIRLELAIDFTSSNGHPSTASSLHSTSAGSANQYASVIAAVGPILLHYCRSGRIGVHGFGARLWDGVADFTESTNHWFPLAGRRLQLQVFAGAAAGGAAGADADPDADGVAGALA
eukprot:gene9434-4522_t